MKNVSCVEVSQLTLYFGLIKTTMTNRFLAGEEFLLQLIEEILSFEKLKFSLNRIKFFVFFIVVEDVTRQL